MIADKSISKVLVTVLFFSCFLLSCATTQDITLTHQQIFGLEKRAENMEKSLRDLKEKDSALELKLQELLKRLADLDIQLRHGQEQFLTLEVRIEEYKQLLDRSLRDRARENEMILMRMDQMQTHLTFADKVKETKRKLLQILVDAKQKGKRIVGYGAPGKGNTLLN